ncbi:MAG: helix-turn-helix domain-containing protein [Bacilli bacterium]|nr:helix-turn-helix domain-containing protein [Bacilli bacterium]MDD4718865.1 helix-turn-helix domain-containing protein [Bacilli bacterium]
MCRTFDVKELSNYLGFSISMIRKLIRQNEITYYKIGSKILFDKEDIDLWWEQKKVNSQEIGEQENGR